MSTKEPPKRTIIEGKHGSSHSSDGHHNGHHANGARGSNGHNGTANGSDNSATHLQIVRPVKARVSNGHDLNGQSNANGTGTGTGNTGKQAVMDESVQKVRVEHASASASASASHDTKEIPLRATTAPLRESDMAELRLRLKTQEWPFAPSTRSRRSADRKRQLPYFMMRHRHMRARSRVGYRRAQGAARRFGNGGAVGIVARLAIVFFILGFVITGAGMGAGFAGASYYISKLPPVDPDHLAIDINQNSVTTQTTKIYDRHGVLLYDLVDEDSGRREELKLDQVSPLVISATIAAEDATFYSNIGIDPIAIVRAIVITLNKEGQSGASTITQQLARNIVLSEDERTAHSLDRKLKEAILAIQLTRTYSKDYILELYLNQTYYGHRAYGIGAAALTYFGKEAKDLTLPEAALLAGLPQSPTEYDPIVNTHDAEVRQGYVLDQMAKQKMITPEQAEAAKAQPLVLARSKPQQEIKAPHFVYYVKQYLEQKYGQSVDVAGLKIYTTLDLDVQAAAEKVAKDRIDDLRKQRATNAAMVVMKPNTGEILAMVGSVDYYDTSIDGQVNVATAQRQPGSSFKPITYVTAFKNGWTPGTVLLDTLTSFANGDQKPYIPKNYDGKDHGWVTVRESLGNSLNIPAVKALQFAGIQNTIDTAHDMGVKGLNRGVNWYGLSLTLGGGEVTLLDMTNAYSTFANGGSEVDANPILQIVDPQNRTIYKMDPNPPANQVVDPRYVYMITSILSDNKARTMEFGADSKLKLSFPAAAKTGTTDLNNDSWTLGYTPGLTIGVWVGNSNNAPMDKITGALGAAYIWHNMMETFYSTPQFVDLVRGPDGSVQHDFIQPDGLIKAYACSAKGDVNDLFLQEAPPKGCVTYKDKNKQLHAAPNSSGPGNPGNNGSNGNGNNTNTNNTRPAQSRARPTPLPGIIYPTPIP